MSETSSPGSKRLSGMRKMIADRLVASLRDAAQLSFHAEADATALRAARAGWIERGERVGIEDLIIAALCRSLERHPVFNAQIVGDTAQFSRDAHVSVAIALPQGLMAPTLFEAQTKTPPELCKARSDLVERARAGKLSVKEMTGGTFTVSNLGLSRVRFFTPILNPPQTAILGLGQIAKRPWVDAEGQLCVRSTLPLSLTVDHRFIDGEPAAAFLDDLAKELEDGGGFAAR